MKSKSMFWGSGRVLTSAMALVVACAMSPAVVALAQTETAAGRLLRDAQRHEREGDLDRAFNTYELVAEQYPETAEAPRALLALAQGRLRRGEVDPAAAATAQLRSAYLRSQSAAGAFVLDARIARDQARDRDGLSAAREEFGAVPRLFGASEYPALEWRALAILRSGELSLLLGELDEAAASFLSLIEDEPPSAHTAAGRLGLATVLLERGDWASAAQALQRVVSDGPASDGETQSALAYERASRRLSLIHRLKVRPQTGQEPWTQARPFTLRTGRLRDPIAVAASADGQVLIADEGSDQLFRVDRDGTIRQQPKLDDLGRPWWDRGTPYALGRKFVSPDVVQPRRSFFVPRERNDPRQLERLAAGARGLFREWFLLDTDQRGVFVFGDDDRYLVTLPGNFERPVDLVTDSRGRAYVLDQETNRVTRFDTLASPGDPVVVGMWGRAQALDIDDLGHLYVLDRDAKQIHVFSPTGELLWRLGPQLLGGVELRDPRDLAVDGSGRLYIADRGAKTIVVLE